MTDVAIVGAGAEGQAVASWLKQAGRLGTIVDADAHALETASKAHPTVTVASTLSRALDQSTIRQVIITQRQDKAAEAAAQSIAAGRDTVLVEGHGVTPQRMSALQAQAQEAGVLFSIRPALAQPAAPDYFVHPSAVVDDPCQIGAGTRIWHFTHVMGNTTLGEGCNLGQNVFIGGGVKLGNNVKIQNNVSVYTGVECEDDVFLGPSMVFTNVINPRSHVNRKNEYKRTLLQQGSSVGANATIVCGVTLGRYAFIGAGSVVTHDVPDFGLVYGVPARLKGHICHCGVKLDFLKPVGTGPEDITCDSCGTVYHKDERGHVTLTHQPTAH